MYIYRTYFKLEAPVLDISEAQDYLSMDDMTEILKGHYPKLADYIINIKWILKDEDSGYIELETSREFTDSELSEMSDWVSGQNSDGLGEGFEQQDFACYRDENHDYEDDYYDDDYIEASFDWKTNEYKFELVVNE